MPINPALLVMAPMLQDYLVDKDTGFPLAGGFVTMFQDTNRTILKNWYYQVGIPGNYSFVPLDNPLQLSSVGTITDPNGNDVIPFYYPYDESKPNTPTKQAYFVQVNSANPNGTMGALQFTRENFPYIPEGNTPIFNEVPTLQNYIINNEFWRNVGTVTLNSATNFVICPSQHDGFQYPDMRWVKDGNGTDILTFQKFTSDNVLREDVTPEFYLNIQCTASGTDTKKYLQIPLSLHLKTLSNQTVSIKFQTQYISGGNTISLGIIAGTGTGQSNSLTTIYDSFVLGGSSWQPNIQMSVQTPSANDPPLTISLAGDDALYLILSFPASSTFNINIAKPELYIGNSLPTNQFDTYDQIDSIICSPRTGDFRTSINGLPPSGWVAANDGSIGSASSLATSRRNQDSWQLYNLLWNNVLDHWAPVSGGRGANAYADFIANKTLTLTRNLGRVIQGQAPVGNFPLTYTADPATDILTIATQTVLYEGMPLQVTNTGGAPPGGLAINTVYYISAANIGGTTLKLAKSIDDARAGLWIDITSAGTGVQSIQTALGAYIGESNHVLIKSELPDPITTTAANQSAAGGATFGAIASSGAYGTGTVSNQGGNQGHNTIQPTSVMNVFIKL